MDMVIYGIQFETKNKEVQLELNHNQYWLYGLVVTFFTTGSASLVECNFAKTSIYQQNLDH